MGDCSNFLHRELGMKVENTGRVYDDDGNDDAIHKNARALSGARGTRCV